MLQINTVHCSKVCDAVEFYPEISDIFALRSSGHGAGLLLPVGSFPPGHLSRIKPCAGAEYGPSVPPNISLEAGPFEPSSRLREEVVSAEKLCLGPTGFGPLHSGAQQQAGLRPEPSAS